MPDIPATRPVAGAPIETAWGQQIHDAIESVLGARSVGVGPIPIGSWPIPYNVATLIPGMSLSAVPAGMHLVFAQVSFDCTSAGFGTAVVRLEMDGVQQVPDLRFICPTAGIRITTAGFWIVNPIAPVTLRLTGMKTTNGGTVQVVQDTAVLTVL